MYSISREESEFPDCQAVGNGDFPVINQDSTFLVYTVGDWHEGEDIEMAEIPVEAWEDQGGGPLENFGEGPPLLGHRKGQNFFISLRGIEPRVLSRRLPGTLKGS